MSGRGLASRVRSAGLITLLAALAACGSAGSASGQQSASSGVQSAGTSQAAIASNVRASAAAGAPLTGDTRAWDEVVAAARAEGQVAVIGQTGTEVAAALSKGFEKSYPGIQVFYSGLGSAEVPPKLLTERSAGKFGTDVVVLGTQTFIVELIPAGAVDPMAPYLIGPDVQDQSKWLGGKMEFADSAQKYNVVFFYGANVPLIYNVNAVMESDIKSYRDLLNPKWKGKIAMTDPLIPGTGFSVMSFLYATPGLGKEFIKQLIDLGPAITRDNRQMVDWVARGQYPIGLAASNFEALDLKKRGLPIEFLPGDKIQEGVALATGWGSVGVINRPPHPNATKVYLNWLLSKQGQEDVGRAQGYPSRRLDTSREGLPEPMIPKPGGHYMEQYSESAINTRLEVMTYLKALLASAPPA